MFDFGFYFNNFRKIARISNLGNANDISEHKFWNFQFLVKLRAFVQEFLKEASKMFWELGCIYTLFGHAITQWGLPMFLIQKESTLDHESYLQKILLTNV